jgi:hypothetical protein
VYKREKSPRNKGTSHSYLVPRKSGTGEVTDKLRISLEYVISREERPRNPLIGTGKPDFFLVPELRFMSFGESLHLT